MKKNFLYAFLASALLFSACSTDLDVAGNWKETMIVYGLLDQGRDTQFIKINKAFLGEGDATMYAQIQDSVQFANALTVQLERIKNGNSLGSVTLVPTNEPKDAGAFYSADQANAIYTFTQSANPTFLNPDSQYKLTVTNSETGTEVTGETGLVADFTFTKPSPTTPSFYFVNTASPNYPFVIEWNTSKNGRIYQLVIRFNYIEYYDYNSDNVIDDSASKKLDWAFTPQITINTNGGEVQTISFPGKNFLKNIAANITSNANVYRRRAGNVDLLVTGGTDDLNTFINVNKPSTGIIQERPEYTNISHGLGIFSSRFSHSAFSRAMETSSIDTLSGGQYTCLLKFYPTVGDWTGCH